MKRSANKIIYSPSDLIRYLASPFASWMDRYRLENPDLVSPDPETEDQRLVARTGDEHEKAVLAELENSGLAIAKIEERDFAAAVADTQKAIAQRAPVVYQAALQDDRFEGYSDFLILDDEIGYELWDTKLARSPRPYYAVQLCCYAEMYAATTGLPMPERFGIILGSGQRVQFRTEDFLHYYRLVRHSFLEMQDGFTGVLSDRPLPSPGADHSRWASHAEQYFIETDSLVQVAGITTGQLKKLVKGGITTMEQLSGASGATVSKLSGDTLFKLSAQARLQCATRTARAADAAAPANYELIVKPAAALTAFGLELLPPEDPADVFFDMEGYPLAPGGLEYLFGASDVKGAFFDWWAHDRAGEKKAFENFIDWVHGRWKKNTGMHIYHYAAYEESALRRLSIRHDTRQEEVDDLLRNGVLIDLYKVVRQALRIGESSYSIKYVEHLYRAKRATGVATAVDSIVQYARWLESGQAQNWENSYILNGIRDYNSDDCISTGELVCWLRNVALENGIAPAAARLEVADNEDQVVSPELQERLAIAKALREKGDTLSITLGDLMDFHRREQKPGWWRMFDRADADAEELFDDPSCISGVCAVGAPTAEKQSQIQNYSFDGSQECKLEEGKQVMFCHDLNAKFTIVSLDQAAGRLSLKIGNKKLGERFGGYFPMAGSLILSDFVSAKEIQAALAAIGRSHLAGELPGAISALLKRETPAADMQRPDEDTITATIRIT
ncbi:MAG: TM0106 family RecB-like putative nuclease, partial [Bacteroidetes bacterium]|nr:TM0106 family RecB-like putative nuclease [Bacteroidota bacterium]